MDRFFDILLSRQKLQNHLLSFFDINKVDSAAGFEVKTFILSFEFEVLSSFFID